MEEERRRRRRARGALNGGAAARAAIRRPRRRRRRRRRGGAAGGKRRKIGGYGEASQLHQQTGEPPTDFMACSVNIPTSLHNIWRSSATTLLLSH
ncbi:Hypothetical predicted protein [Podarcis lilfordi]|uniref:Uncharacterized protein n=1 Tax=Podarcis lilfordi TaxID=74358 RepID=A0AA35P5B4_9SAUR|nr:Hypothetical predicted protein [Podarcis lilfordi]